MLEKIATAPQDGQGKSPVSTILYIGRAGKKWMQNQAETGLITKERILTHLEVWQERMLFKPKAMGVKPALSPEKYIELKPYNVNERFIRTDDGEKICVWQKNAEPGKPHFILFHGNSYNWGSVINAPKVRGQQKPKHRVASNERLHFLRKILDEGAGFTAVSLRGFGKSTGKPGEDGFDKDIRAVVEDILEVQKIPGSDIIIAGESMGGANAVKAALELKKHRHPPAMVVTINTFFNMARQAHDVMARGLPNDLLLKNVSIPTEEEIGAILRHPFKTNEAILQLSPATHFICAYAPNDEFIDCAHSKDLIELVKAANQERPEDKKISVAPIEFHEDAGHCHWPQGHIVKKIMDHFDAMKGNAISPDFLSQILAEGRNGSKPSFLER